MTDHALLLVHRASRSVERLVQVIREKGFEPTVLASRPPGPADSFKTLCAKLEVRFRMTAGSGITLSQAMDVIESLPGRHRFAISVWDGHRRLVAQVNQLLGANDMPPAAIARVQDKLATRQALFGAGLSSIRARRVSDPALQAAMDGRKRFVARPRRGIGSLLTAVVTRLDEALQLDRHLAATPAEGDLFSEFFGGNEIFVEDFFEGREFSLDLIRFQGRTVSACWHEKTEMRITQRSVLECALASPPVSSSLEELAIGQAFCERVMAALEMRDGSFHVELLHGGGERWELIEVNARPGGALVSESVYQQFGARPSADWVDVLAGRAPARHGPARCGTFQQVAYPTPGQVIERMVRRQGVPGPDISLEALPLGAVAQADREDYAVANLWRTSLSSHATEVALLSEADYVSFEYAPCTAA